jgi:hypothetical protein
LFVARRSSKLGHDWTTWGFGARFASAPVTFLSYRVSTSPEADAWLAYWGAVATTTEQGAFPTTVPHNIPPEQVTAQLPDDRKEHQTGACVSDGGQKAMAVAEKDGPQGVGESEGGAIEERRGCGNDDAATAGRRHWVPPALLHKRQLSAKMSSQPSAAVGAQQGGLHTYRSTSPGAPSTRAAALPPSRVPATLLQGLSHTAPLRHLRRVKLLFESLGTGALARQLEALRRGAPLVEELEVMTHGVR